MQVLIRLVSAVRCFWLDLDLGFILCLGLCPSSGLGLSLMVSTPVASSLERDARGDGSPLPVLCSTLDHREARAFINHSNNAHLPRVAYTFPSSLFRGPCLFASSLHRNLSVFSSPVCATTLRCDISYRAFHPLIFPHFARPPDHCSPVCSRAGPHRRRSSRCGRRGRSVSGHRS